MQYYSLALGSGLCGLRGLPGLGGLEALEVGGAPGGSDGSGAELALVARPCLKSSSMSHLTQAPVGWSPAACKLNVPSLLKAPDCCHSEYRLRSSRLQGLDPLPGVTSALVTLPGSRVWQSLEGPSAALASG